LIRRILLRSALFALPASGLWALLPLVARDHLHLDSAGYGVMLGALGVGAVLGIFVLPLARARVSDNIVIAASAILFAIGAAASGFLPFTLTLVLLVFSGAAWIGTLTVLNASLQLTLPQWVRARGGGTYILVFMGTMAIGSYLWGLVAEAIGSSAALAVTGGLLLLVGASVRLWPLLPQTGRIDRTIDLSWPVPTLVFEPRPTDGPVTVMVTYRVVQQNISEFERAMQDVRRSRLRTGATRWRLYRSGERADSLLEVFVVPSWAEYRRQQTQRLTGRDREYRAAAIEFSETVPTEEHYFPPEVHPGRQLDGHQPDV
jgi:MFS family permease